MWMAGGIGSFSLWLSWIRPRGRGSDAGLALSKALQKPFGLIGRCAQLAKSFFEGRFGVRSGHVKQCQVEHPVVRARPKAAYLRYRRLDGVRNERFYYVGHPLSCRRLGAL